MFKNKIKQGVFASIFAVGMLAVFLLLFPVGTIMSGSMYPTLQVGDFYISKRVFNINKVDRFDIVTSKGETKNDDLLKRVIGLPNETIEILDGSLYIDSVLISDEFAFNSNMSSHSDFGPYLIPSDEVFLVGDNRDYSLDSRHFGSVKLSSIKYKLVKAFSISNLKANKEFF